jgi:hypothetical protein
MRTILLAAAGAAMLAVAGCSSTDMAEFNVAMQEMNGTYWPDQSDWVSHDCASGYGYITEYSGVQNNEGYLYFTSYADDVEIDVSYDDGDSYSLQLGYGETSYTIYNHPGFGWNTQWAC